MLFDRISSSLSVSRILTCIIPKIIVVFGSSWLFDWALTPNKLWLLFARTSLISKKKFWRKWSPILPNFLLKSRGKSATLHRCICKKLITSETHLLLFSFNLHLFNILLILEPISNHLKILSLFCTAPLPSSKKYVDWNFIFLHRRFFKPILLLPKFYILL